MTKGLPVTIFLAVFVCSIVLIGCKGRSDNPQEAGSAEAKVLLLKVNSDLAKAKKELTGLKEELEAVKGVRDELEKQLRQESVTREKAIDAAEAAQRIIQNMTAQINEKNENISLLEREIRDLKVLVEDQRATIAEQQASIAELEQVVGQQTTPEQQQENVESKEEPPGQGGVIE